MKALENLGWVLSAAVPALLVVRWLRLRDREPDWGVVVGEGETPPVERVYSCIGLPGGNIHGNCAESWWDHFWNDRPYCSDRQFWCEAGGGTFTKR